MARCNIVIIGNAPYDFKLPLGRFIDSFENIMRFNTFSVTGHDKYVGSKTTIWCYWPHSPAMRKLRSCETHNKIKGHPQEIVYGKKKVNDGLAKIIPRKHVLDKLRRKLLRQPSTGIIGIAWALYEGYRPLVIGFNGFKNKGSQHYYEQWNRSKCFGHSGNKEMDYLKELHQEGKIYFLDSTIE
jgi:hypothetical protein